MLETVVEQGSSRTSIGCFSRKVTKQELGGNSGMKQRDLVNGLDSRQEKERRLCLARFQLPAGASQDLSLSLSCFPPLL